MEKKPLRLRLKAAFSAAVLGLAGATSAVYAQEAPAAASEPVPDFSDLPRMSSASVTDRRGVEARTDDFFSTRYKVYATKENVWIGMPQRYNVDLFSLPDNDVVRFTRQYLELRPMRKEWYGRASGVGIGFEYELGREAGYALGGGTWHMRGGTFIGSFESPHVKGESRVQNNEVFNTFVEGARDVNFGTTGANLIVGVSFNRAAGPDVERASDMRVYQQINFPSLFGGGAAGAGGTGVGCYSGAVQTYAGDGGAYGGKAGLYYNNLKPEGTGVNFSVGPEVHYDNERGTSFRLRVRVSPRFL